MSVPKVVKGQYWYITVSIDGGTTYQQVCGLTQRNRTRQAQTSREYIRDCGDPQSIPDGVVNITGQTADMSGTGLYNRAQGPLIRRIFGQSLPYRFYEAEDANDPVDSGYWSGNYVLSNFQEGAADGTNVTAQFTWESDGPQTYTPGADTIVLDPLFLTPTTATHGVTYTGTIQGATTGSTLAVTSSDGTSLTVTGTGATRTISGTFTNPGNDTLTIVETLTAAPNSPKTTTASVNVA